MSFDIMAPQVFPVVYLIVSRTELLYAGSTVDFDRRLAEHARRSPWFRHAVEAWPARMSSIAAARQVEARLIADFRPVHNVQHIHRGDHPLLAGEADSFDLRDVTFLRERAAKFLGIDPAADPYHVAALDVSKRMGIAMTVAQVTR